MVEEYIELEDIDKDRKKAKVKGFFKKVGSAAKSGARSFGVGAGRIGAAVKEGAVKTGERIQEYNKPENVERRLVSKEKVLKQRIRINKLQSQAGGMGGGIGMGGFGNFGLSGNGGNNDSFASKGLSAGFGSIMGTSTPAVARSPRRYRTVKTKTKTRKLMGRGKKRKYRTYNYN